MTLADIDHDRLLEAIDKKSDEVAYNLLPTWQEGLADPAVCANRQDDIEMIIDYLSTQINKKQWADSDLSIWLAEMIITIGESLKHTSYLALGKMLLGDSIAIQGKHFKKAWNLLGEAGELFLEIGDEVGWARTRTGRLGICSEVGEMKVAEEDARKATQIFKSEQLQDYLLRLRANEIAVLNYKGKFKEIIAQYSDLKSLLETSDDYYRVAAIRNNVGNAYWYVGDISNSIDLFSSAKEDCLRSGNFDATRITALNLIGAQRALGRYDNALAELNSLLLEYGEKNSIYAIRARIEIVECSLALNRFKEAIKHADGVEQYFLKLEEGAYSDKAHLYRLKAEAFIELHKYDLASDALNQAKTFFSLINSKTWLADCDFQLGNIEFRQGNFQKSLEFAQDAATYFKETNHYSAFVKCCLLLSTAKFGLYQYQDSHFWAQKALILTRQIQLPAQRLQAHHLLAKISDAQNMPAKSKRHYQAAFAILKVLRRRLTVTLANDYLSGKDEIFHGLMTHMIEEKNTAGALDLLETNRAFAVSDYVFSRDRMLWRKDDSETSNMISALEHLREQQGFLYKQANERDLLKPDEIAISTSDDARKRLALVENDIQHVLESLYLRSAQASNFAPYQTIKTSRIQTNLCEDEAVIVYYFKDKGCVYLITKTEIQQVKLEISSERLAREIDRLRFNMVCATQSFSDPQTSKQLRILSDRICKILFQSLLEPVWALIQDINKLTILPFGPLHSLPFNLLITDRGYLIETHEVVLAPSFHFVASNSKRRTENGIVFTDDRNGLLPQTKNEGELVAELMNINKVFHNQEADLGQMQNENGAILHIAAHGEHRQDHPQFSFIELSGKKHFVDDLLQKNIDFDLVTLSGCETGVVTPQNYETLVGLTHAVLMSGAGAVLASYWRVEDEVTQEWMHVFYSFIWQGASKSFAKQATQKHFIKERPELHPAFWAAFQLIGNSQKINF